MSDASMSPALAAPAPTSPHPALEFDDDAATRNESPPVTTPADHPELGAEAKAAIDTAMASPPRSPLPLAYPDPEPVPTPPADVAPSAPAVKRELPADDDEHVAKRARSEGSPSAMVLTPDVPAPMSAPAAGPAPMLMPAQDPPLPPFTGVTQMSSTQHKFCLSSVRILKRCKDAAPFLRPVDPVALNIPHYPQIIKRPMDFSTVETRLQNSNPTKPPTDPSAHRYRTTDDFVSDVRQIFQNCYLFNGPEHFISNQARKLEDTLDRQIQQMPPDEEPAPRYESPIPKKPSVPPARRQSTSVPTIRRNTPDDFPSPVVRPKREIHPPPPKDLPYAEPVQGKRGRKGKARDGERDDGTRDQLRYCQKILLEFNKKSLYQVAGPFYEPVDATYVPNYYKVIKRPMDLATMRKKLDDGEYPNAHAFHNDFRLMMRNCISFNPPGTAVHTAGMEMDKIFKEKWKNLPPLRPLTPEDEEASGSDDEHSGEDTDLAIAMMESQIETMKDSLALLKAKKKNSLKPKAVAAPPPKEKKSPVAPPKKPARKPSTSSYAPPYVPPAPGPSKAKPAPAPKPAKNVPPPKKGKTGTGSDTERTMPIMSFEQKKELSTTIESLDGDKLERVIQIIYEGMPDLQNSNEEIELDIESLTPAVLTKLWNFVVKPNQQKKLAVSSNGPKRTSGNASKGAAATGGVKRKSMDEALESERIRKLEAQINRFGKPPGANGGLDTNMDDDARSSAGSASESDSGSESD